jgi:alpha-tubulin suppressor-like RCC1 family protein
MSLEKRSVLALVALGFVLALAGCGTSQDAQEVGAKGVDTRPQAMIASDIHRVELTTSGQGMATRTDALVNTDGQWGGVLGQLPAGTGRTLSARAFDSSNTVRFSGQVKDISIQAGQTTAVTLLLQEVNAPLSFQHAAPRILSLVASPAADDSTSGSTAAGTTGFAAVTASFNTWPQVVSVTASPTSVAVGQATQVSADASDEDGDFLGYQWTATCAGSWTNASSASPSFTPSEEPSSGRCTLFVNVQDGRGGEGNGSLSIHVGPPTPGGFPPEIVETFQSVASVPAAGGTVVFRVRAKDVQGSALTFTWSTRSGTLGTASHSGTSSEVLWTALGCVPGSPPPTVTATVTNALNLSASYVFSLQGGASCGSMGARLASRFHALAAKQDGTVWAWGWNGYGQVGNGTTAPQQPFLVQVAGLSSVVAVAAGGTDSLALKQDGTVWAWGWNAFGQLGDGTTTERWSPVQVTALTGVAAVSKGDLSGYAVKQDGTVWAWGGNTSGQLGDGTTAHRLSPVHVQGLTDVVSVSAGHAHAHALKQDGTVWAWGWNAFGQLGDGTTTDRLSPVQVEGLTGVVAVTVGYDETYALRQDGTVWAWGRNTHGQLGDGTTADRHSPAEVPGLTGVIAVAAGEGHALALRQDGTVWVWGYNVNGQLGEAATTNLSSPAQVPGLTGVMAVAAGYYTSYAVKQDGTVWVWGRNAEGQFGDGTTVSRSTPVQVWGLSL